MAFLYGSGGEVAQSVNRKGDWAFGPSSSVVELDTSVYHTGGGSWRFDPYASGIGEWMYCAMPYSFADVARGKTSGKIWATFAVRRNGNPQGVQGVQFLGIDIAGKYRRVATTLAGGVNLYDSGWNLLAAGSGTPFANNTWFACQVEVDMDNDRIRVVFGPAANELASTIINYGDSFGTSAFNRFEFGTVAQKGTNPQISMWEDDFFINDDSGIELNYRPTHLMRAYPIKPDGNGYWGEWSGDYGDVDEVSPVVPVDTSDYISSGTGMAAVSETHSYQNPGGAENIHGVCLFVAGAITSGSNGSLYALERSNGVDRATIVDSGLYGEGTAPCPQMRDAEGNNWTTPLINAAEWGVRRGAAASNPRDIRAHALWAYVFRSPQPVPPPQPPPTGEKHYGWLY